VPAGIASPHDCALFGGACTPDTPVGACMVSAEGTCKIWQLYGGHPDLRQEAP
jgi:hydrogenase expression/formation protein HypD